MSKTGRFLYHSSLNMFLMVCMLVSQAIADPVIVAQTGANSDLSNPRQIVRTTTGRIYYLNGNAGRTTTWDGWIEVQTSGNGSSWSKESTRDQWYLGSDIGVSIDSKNILHVVSYDWNHRPYYVRYNTADSPTANFTWDGYELLETTKTSDIGKSSVAVDANGKPHIVYQSLESYKGKTYYTLTYANRVGTAWSKVAIWPASLKTSFSGKIEIAIGYDNIPYILMGNKILKGNTNAATSFEAKDLISAGTSFVIQPYGHIKVSQVVNGKYAILSHDFRSPWSSGWTLQESTAPDTGSIMLLANDTLYAARLDSEGIWLQKNLDPPFLAVSRPANSNWQSLTARWSYYNNYNNSGMIDLGTRSWDQQSGNLLWYSASPADSRAKFVGGPFYGTAPLAVTFYDSSLPRPGSNITSWLWDFDNDGVPEASGPKATHLYTTTGIYSVSLAVTDSTGGQDKTVMSNLVQVHPDTDGDGVPDPADNCPNDYNPTQLDLNNNAIGDACESPSNRLAKALYMTGLKSNTSADTRGATDVTGIMTDGLIDQKIDLIPASKDALAVQINKDASNIKKLIMRFYLNFEGSMLTSRVYIMPYNGDLKTTIDAGLSGGNSGWNEVDLTRILHRMDGYGLTKFRIVPINDPKGFSIYEVSLKEYGDDREINVYPAYPSSLDFGEIEVTETSSPQEIKIINSGTETLKIVRVKPPSWPFTIVSDDCTGKELLLNSSCIIKASFTSQFSGHYNDVVTIESNDVDKSSQKVAIQGAGVLVLRGVVTDSVSSKPLYDVAVEVTDSQKTYNTTTDINGSYTISGLSAGNYLAKFRRFDYVTYTKGGVILQSQKNSLNPQLVYNHASISGNVTDQSGAPMSGVNVTLELSGIKTADLMASCYDKPLTSNDYQQIQENDGNKYSCSNLVLKARNPNGVNESFAVKWNGTAASLDNVDFIAQQFKPNRSGKLTKVSINSPGFFYDKTVGSLFVVLKSSLGSQCEIIHAISNTKYQFELITRTSNWIDFTFPNPPMIMAGEEYYIEVIGSYYTKGEFLGLPTESPYYLPWGITDSYPNGKAYERKNGIWIESPNSLAFGTFVDEQPDIVTTPVSGGYLSMYGGNLVSWGARVQHQVNGGWLDIPFIYDSSTDNSVCHEYDNTAKGNFDDFQSYYDSNHTVTINARSKSEVSGLLYGQPGASVLLTDQLSLTFNRILTTTTDANGNYSFSSLAGSDYKIQFIKPGYYSSNSGILAFGQQKNLDIQATSVTPPSINITSPLNGAVYYFSGPITVTGKVSGNTSVSVNGIAATVANGNFSSNIYINNGNNIVTAIAKGQYGQEATSSISITKAAAPIIGSISTKDITADTAVISWLTDQPATSVVEYGQSTAYGSSVTDSVLSTTHYITIPSLKPGTTYHFRVSSTTAYNYNSFSGDVSFATLPFSLKNIGDTGNVTVMEITGNYDARNTDGTINDLPRKAVAAEYFKNHPDKDFLVFFSSFDYTMPEAGAQGFYTEVKNDTQGINRTLLNNSALFGSAGMLQGTIDMGNVTQLAGNPFGPKLEETLTTLSHELGHRWLAAARFKNPDGTLNTSLIGRDSAHWSYLLDSKGSLMYGSGWKDNGDGTFTSISKQSAFSPLDLYLMGMIDKSQVSPMLLIDNPSIDKNKLPELGATVSGTARTITIDDIIAAEGERVPNAATAPKTFNIGFVLLTRPGDNASAATQAVETLRKAWAGRIAELTQGKGSIVNVTATIEIAVDSPLDGATVTGPDVSVSGSFINTTGAETGINVNGIPATVSGNRFIVNRVPTTEGVNTHTITATDVNGLTSTTTRSVTAQAGNYIRINPNVESGSAPLNISLRLDGSFSIANPQVSYSGPVPVTLVPGTSSTEFTATLTVEGAYTFTVSGVGPDGQTYSNTVTITVLPRYLLETLLKSKWEGMKQKIATGDTVGAGSYFPEETRDMFQAIFNDPSMETMSRLNEISEIKIYTIQNDTAQGGAIRQEDDGIYAYPVNFTRDENGIWRIYGF